MGGSRALVQDLRVRIDRRHMTTSGELRGGIVLHEVRTPDGSRQADAIAVNFIRSRVPVVGYEIKVARSDWLNELAQPDKAAWAAWCHEWWVIAPPGVVRVEELPRDWGLLEPEAKVRARIVRAAGLRENATMPTDVAVELVKKADTMRADEVSRIWQEARTKHDEAIEAVRAEAAALGATPDVMRDAERFRKLLQAMGLRHLPWSATEDDSPEVRALLAAAGGTAAAERERQSATERFRRTVYDLRSLLGDAEKHLERLTEKPPSARQRSLFDEGVA